MKNSIKENVKIAILAIKLLKKAILRKDKKQILVAYKMVEDDSFSWEFIEDDFRTDVLFIIWDRLTDKANDIFYL